jgi:hypothetical protein
MINMSRRSSLLRMETAHTLLYTVLSGIETCISIIYAWLYVSSRIIHLLVVKMTPQRIPLCSSFHESKSVRNNIGSDVENSLNLRHLNDREGFRRSEYMDPPWAYIRRSLEGLQSGFEGDEVIPAG